MEALALIAPTNAGAIDGKVVVCNYSFILRNEQTAFDAPALERVLCGLQEAFKCHVTVRSSWASVQSDLFGSPSAHPSYRGGLVVSCRLVRHQPLDQPVTDFIGGVERGFESVSGADGRLRWFERTEGSSDYIRLLAEVPSTARVPGL
jgi:hypothetical protein